MNEMSTSLVAILNEQISCAQAMLATLARENQALVDGDADSLNAAGAEKARLVEALDSLEHERQSLSDAIGLTFAVASDKSADASRPAEWRALLDLIAECKQQNQRNGALVKARSEQVRIALRALRGTEAALYDPSGLEHAARGTRQLGTA
jgi:flagella synthesis protein FlgN